MGAALAAIGTFGLVSMIGRTCWINSRPRVVSVYGDFLWWLSVAIYAAGVIGFAFTV